MSTLEELYNNNKDELDKIEKVSSFFLLNKDKLLDPNYNFEDAKFNKEALNILRDFYYSYFKDFLYKLDFLYDELFRLITDNEKEKYSKEYINLTIFHLYFDKWYELRNFFYDINDSIDNEMVEFLRVEFENFDKYNLFFNVLDEEDKNHIEDFKIPKFFTNNKILDYIKDKYLFKKEVKREEYGF